MSIYFYFLLAVSIIWIINIPFISNNENKVKYIRTINWIFFILIFLGLFFLAYFRGIEVGTDYSLYYSFFYSKLYKEFFDPFIVIIFSIADLFNDFRWVTIVSTLVFLSMFYYMQKKYAYSIVNFLFLFLTSFVFFFFLNGLRQALAMAVLWIGLMALIKGRKKDVIIYIIIVIIAAQFHISAYMALVFIFAKYFKVNIRMLSLGFFLVCLGYFTDVIKGSLSGILMNIDFYTAKYSNDLDFFFEQNKEKGLLQFIPILVQFVFFYIWIAWKEFKKIEIGKYVENYYFIFLVFYAASGIEAIDRFQFYLYPSVIFFYDMVIFNILKNTETKREQIMVWLFSCSMIVFWIVYYSLRVIQNNNGIIPYSLW